MFEIETSELLRVYPAKSQEEPETPKTSPASSEVEALKQQHLEEKVNDLEKRLMKAEQERDALSGSSQDAIEEFDKDIVDELRNRANDALLARALSGATATDSVDDSLATIDEMLRKRTQSTSCGLVREFRAKLAMSLDSPLLKLRSRVTVT